jgi:glycosyltransferase involved in cell wall biosynthesis
MPSLPGVTVVSVIVPTRDRLQLLPLALESVAAQAGPELRLQIVVVDNGGDGPAVRSIAQQFGAEYTSTRARGPGAVRNVGLALARGDYVAFLDDDDLWTADHLRSHLDALERDPSLAATVSRQRLGDASGRQLDLPAIPPDSPSGTDMFPFFLSYFPSVCAVVARGAAARAVGGFDERLIAGEDWDWNLRLAFGQRVGFVDRVTFVIRSRAAWTPDQARTRWLRLWFWHRVFWRHVLRAGRRRPALRELVRIYRADTGMFAHWLCGCAAQSLRSGDRGGYLLNLGRAFVASPPHTVAWLARRA